eukprot:CAMPEP_0201527690 /NCGR_PEP_ID=MMETSP0161_2-20130828/35995_1 /ASSEMBLY_ACC=CAM_ASM_000251 /TAXON_ID=180227 /ORGANISM="Neoparamoeba aestuarina, Strain SoJaBio B1-5/56/2" /LENGTH=457 /DNA_ID=CAMNT_0047928617 /DNA_START=257 /DNA_END=1627 /DNA_ORIENTATION=+
MTMKFDFDDCPSDVITILKQMGPNALVQKDVQYVIMCLLVLPGSGTKTTYFLNNNISLNEQNVPEDGFLALYPYSQLTKLTAETLARESPELSGYLTKSSIKGGKATPTKRRWCVLHYHFLYYYKAQQGSPSGVIPLEFYGAYVNSDDPLAIKLVSVLVDAPKREGSFMKDDAKHTFLLKFESEKQFGEWFPKIARHCANYASNQVFGIPLSTLMGRKASWFSDIPEIAYKTFNYLKKEMSVEGLFRLSGSSSQVAMYKSMWETGIVVDYEKETPDPHTVASLFKLWLREMPEPLFPRDKYDDFIQLEKKTKNEKLAIIPRLIAGLKRENKNLVRELIQFAYKVSEKSEINKMTPNNLAIVFAPTLLQASKDNMMNMAADSSTIVSITEFIIANATPLFDTNPKNSSSPSPSLSLSSTTLSPSPSPSLSSSASSLPPSPSPASSSPLSSSTSALSSS